MRNTDLEFVLLDIFSDLGEIVSVAHNLSSELFQLSSAVLCELSEFRWLYRIRYVLVAKGDPSLNRKLSALR